MKKRKWNEILCPYCGCCKERQTIQSRYQGLQFSFRKVFWSGKDSWNFLLNRSQVETYMTFLGFVALYNPTKDEAPEVIEELREADIRTIIVSGKKRSPFILQWRHNGCDGVSNHSVSIVCSTVFLGADQRKRQKSVSLATCEGNPPVTGGFPSQRASNAINGLIWWCHHSKWMLSFHVKGLEIRRYLACLIVMVGNSWTGMSTSFSIDPVFIDLKLSHGRLFIHLMSLLLDIICFRTNEKERNKS